ncbi:histidine phosphatase family protein [Cytophagaceae bacterium YF14B1]|uniref:Histidine phosphatase family protein n=1 Tax=Xanthocytophaga flava TaxID=3048013 RepID=A0AAE3U8A3_9BACT|nr:histidine phosphatase family protein [Xanthocytophaga flavus]MDJ1483809.1 histidine phosphatase family protein [Xanthocytophaga flavus]
MKTKEIYLIRHGETDYNRKGIVQGSGVDTDLNDLGRSQAQAFFEKYQHIPFKKVYTSVLKRAIQSVSGFLSLGLPHEKYAGLNEISWGHREGQRITPEEDAYYHSVLAAWADGEDYLRIDGGESPADVQARQKPVIDTIVSRPEEDVILVCMHGRAMRILLSMLAETPLKDMDQYEHSNLCLYKLEYDGKKFTIVAHNDIQHLQKLTHFMH